MKYSKRRRIGSGIDETDLEDSLKVIVNHFDKTWLEKSNSHHLQLLWKRRDPLATNELYTFGKSIQSLESIDEKWIKDTVRSIKKGDSNNISGFTFEIIASAMFFSNHELKLSSKSNPGYDMSLIFEDKSKINISFKSLLISRHYELFNQKSKEIESYFLEICEKLYLNHIECLIINKSEHYAEKRDFNFLKDLIDELSKKYDGVRKISIEKGIWKISFAPLNSRGKWNNKKNYTFLICSNFHNNEKNNLYSKFEDACDNIDQHGSKQSNEIINIIMIKIPDRIDINYCKKWGENYLKEHTNKEISGILFIQNVVGRDIKLMESQLITTYSFVKNNTFNDWAKTNPEKRKFKLEIIVSGKIMKETPELKVFDLTKNKTIKEKIKDSYYYQHGKSYNLIMGAGEASLTSVASGIHQYGVWITPEGKMILNVLNPDFEELILI